MMTPEHTLRQRLVWTITAALLCGVHVCAQNVTQMPMSASQPASMKSAARAGRMQPAAKRSSGRKQVKIRTRAGDTLALLADRFGVTSEEIAQLNGVDAGARIDAGHELLIPLPSSESLMRASAERMSQHNNTVAMNAGVDAAIETDGEWVNVQGVLMRKGTGPRTNESSRDDVARSNQDVNEQRRSGETQSLKIVEVGDAARSTARQPVWIYLVGGARVEADDVTETVEGVWYKRGGLSVFIERARIERIERERVSNVSDVVGGTWTERGWTTGKPHFDALIKESGARYGVDPYLIFCVMEQESHFNQYVVSPKGARGLMQLMPATARNFGVRRIFDPAENIMGGTKYLKQLLDNFNGRVDLVLAGYNAGEGAVARFGGNVPPYKETRNYVKRISKRYGQSRSFVPGASAETASTAPTGLR